MSAQSVAPNSQNNAASPGIATEAAVQLSPFVVSTETDDGWLAAHTILSNRTNQPLKEVAASIEALTPEFLLDVGAFDAFEALQFATNTLIEPEYTMAQSVGTGGGSNLENNRYSYRGISNEGQPSRNLWSNAGMPTDTYNVERIEVGRGSNSLLFGEVEAGGQGNVSTKRATIGRNFGSVLAQIGSYESYRASLDYNRSFSPRFAARLNLTRNSGKRDYDWNEFNTDAVHGAVTYRPFQNTVIRAEAEWGLYARNWGTNQMLMDERVAPGRGFNQKWNILRDNTVLLNTTLPAADRNLPNGVRHTLLDVDPGGLPRHYNWAPNQFNDKEMTTVSVYLEQRVKDFAFELAFNQQIRTHKHETMKQTNLLRIDSAGRRFIDYTYAMQSALDKDRNYRAMATYDWKPFGWMKQLFVGSAAYSETDAHSAAQLDVNQLDAAGGVVNPTAGRLWYRVYVDEPGAYSAALLDRRLSLPETASFRAMRDFQNNANSNYRELQTYTFSMTGSYWGGRLLSQAGFRLDRAKAYDAQAWVNANRRPDGQAVAPGSYEDHPDRFVRRVQLNTPKRGDISKNFGLTYKINERINIYGVYSESFRQADGNAFNFVGEPLGQQRGETKEVGIKSDFFKRKLVWTLAAFDITRQNVAINFSRSILTFAELEDLINPNDISPTDSRYLTAQTQPAQGAGRDERTAYSKGIESSLTFQAIEGLRVRLGAGYQKVANDPDTTMARFKELLAAAVARGNENPALIAGAQRILDEVGAAGLKVAGRGAAPFTFNYALTYQFKALKGFSVGLNGNYNSDYVLNYIDNVEYRGGKFLSVHGTAAYQTRLWNRRVAFRLNVKDLIETDYVTRNVVKLANGAVRNQNYYGIPRSYMLTTTLDF